MALMVMLFVLVKKKHNYPKIICFFPHFGFPLQYYTASATVDASYNCCVIQALAIVQYQCVLMPPSRLIQTH